MLKRIFLIANCGLLIAPSWAVSVEVSVNGNPITDIDITERTKIMDKSLDNRTKAREAIIDDYIKLEYAKSLKLDPTEKEVDAAIKDNGDNPQMKLAVRAGLAWQAVVMKTVAPGISVGEKEIEQEYADLERERGLPLEITFVRLVDVPENIHKKLTGAASCDNAEDIAKKLGGEPQKITAMEYDLAPEIRDQFIGLPLLSWSPLTDKKTVLVCEKKKTKEWGKLDDIIKQNAVMKRAMFQSDQLLKQLRRKATII